MKKSALQLCSLTTALLLMSSAAAVLAQDKQPPNDKPVPPPGEKGFVILGPESSPLSSAPFLFGQSEFSFEKLIKGAPYSAQSVTHATQTLSDGNRITSEISFAVYRDSKGRTRREIVKLAGASSAGAQPERITINDPATGDAYELDPATRTAIKNHVLRLSVLDGAPMKSPAAGAPPEASFEIAVPPSKAPMQVQNFGFARVAAGEVKLAPMEGKAPQDGDRAAPHNESLGTQIIEGVEARGTRTTFTIPAGKIGNERPIEIIDESWYSPELQTIVMSRHSDPRSGEIVYKLTNIDRAEPDDSLFQVPADYQIKELSDTFFAEPLGDKPPPPRRTRTVKPELEP